MQSVFRPSVAKVDRDGCFLEAERYVATGGANEVVEGLRPFAD